MTKRRATRGGIVVGGIVFGDVGGSVDVRAGGDIVAGDKTSAQAPAPGFAGEAHRTEFLRELDSLRQALVEALSAVEQSRQLDDVEKQGLIRELISHVRALAEVKEVSSALPVGKPPAPGAVARVESTLNRASGVLDALHAVAQRGVGLATALEEVIAKYGPLLLGARRLFGLP